MSRFISLLFPILHLPRWQKRLVSIVVDSFALIFLSVVALSLRFGEWVVPELSQWLSIGLLTIIAVSIFIRFGLYRAVVRYVSLHFAYTVFIAVSLAFLVWAASLFLLGLTFSRSAIIIDWLLILLFVTGSRVLVRGLLSRRLTKNAPPIKKRIVIYGAGNAGQQLFHACLKIPFIHVVGFIDDCRQLQNNKIHSINVFAPNKLDSLIENHNVSDVFLAIPSLSSTQKQKILDNLEPKLVKVSILPPMDKIIDGNIQLTDVREVDVEDLLGRDPVPAKLELLSQCISKQVVLVTGAGGSIGSEICRQVVKQKPKQLILFELNEFALYQMDKSLQGEGVEVVSVLGSVLNEKKLVALLQRYRVDTIYHAAAYKHVPLVEHNIAEGVRNNTFGTYTLARVAAQNQVQNFVLVSTDKAVRPTNFMGASKRLAELALQALQPEYPNTRFVMVRFGNVLGSSGSVIPLFRQQIKNGGPVTVTHPEINRFFMTIPEAASLVIQAGSMGTGGDVFVLDMGEPVKIVDLARRMIRLSGLEVLDGQNKGDIEIQFTGLRPGEKLYEELLIGDSVDGTPHPKIMKATEYSITLDEFDQALVDIEIAIRQHDFELVRDLIKNLVKGFYHEAVICDYLKYENNKLSK